MVDHENFCIAGILIIYLIICKKHEVSTWPSSVVITWSDRRTDISKNSGFRYAEVVSVKFHYVKISFRFLLVRFAKEVGLH